MEENFSMEWNMEENFSMEWKIFGMEWKKIASMEYGKIVFHSIPYHALAITWVPKITYQYKFFNSFITSTVIFSEKVVAIRKRRARKQKKWTIHLSENCSVLNLNFTCKQRQSWDQFLSS